MCKPEECNCINPASMPIENMLMKLHTVQSLLTLHGLAESQDAEPLDGWSWSAIHANLADVVISLEGEFETLLNFNQTKSLNGSKRERSRTWVK